jgi:hypothetical protein
LMGVLKRWHGLEKMERRNKRREGSYSLSNVQAVMRHWYLPTHALRTVDRANIDKAVSASRPEAAKR